jgi:DNA-binding transcriptional MocR family regulator
MSPARVAAAHAEALGEWRARGDGTLPEHLADALAGALLDGRIPLAVALPSERTLAGAIGASRATVSDAYALLRERGWLQTRQGARAQPLLPPALDEGLAPRDGTPAGTELIDLTLAAPAAPAGAYLAALERARGRIGAHLATTGVADAGLPELRARIAERHTRAGLPTRPEQVLVTSGAVAALQLALAPLPARAAALAELPTFPLALDALRDRGRRVSGWPVAAGWDAELFASLVQRRAARVAYVIPDFHNPTGRLASGEEREALAAAARREGVLLVVDETMRELDLRTAGVPEPPLAALAAEALTLGSLSKLVWSGLRVSWLRAPRTMVEQLVRHPLMAACSPPPLEQLIALELFDELDALAARRRRTLRARLAHLLAAIDGLDGLAATQPAGGLSVWATLRGSSGRLAERAASAGVRLAPGGRFSPDAPLDHNLRIPFALPEPLLDAALARIAPLL